MDITVSYDHHDNPLARDLITPRLEWHDTIIQSFVSAAKPQFERFKCAALSFHVDIVVHRLSSQVILNYRLGVLREGKPIEETWFVPWNDKHRVTINPPRHEYLGTHNPFETLAYGTLATLFISVYRHILETLYTETLLFGGTQ